MGAPLPSPVCPPSHRRGAPPDETDSALWPSISVLLFATSFLSGLTSLLSLPFLVFRRGFRIIPTGLCTSYVVKDKLDLLTPLMPPPALHAGTVGIQHHVRLSCVFNLCPLDGSQDLPQSLQPLQTSLLPIQPPSPCLLGRSPISPLATPALVRNSSLH